MCGRRESHCVGVGERNKTSTEAAGISECVGHHPNKVPINKINKGWSGGKRGQRGLTCQVRVKGRDGYICAEFLCLSPSRALALDEIRYREYRAKGMDDRDEPARLGLERGSSGGSRRRDPTAALYIQYEAKERRAVSKVDRGQGLSTASNVLIRDQEWPFGRLSEAACFDRSVGLAATYRIGSGNGTTEGGGTSRHE